MPRVYNFSAGPAVLPEEVLRKAADEMILRETGLKKHLKRLRFSAMQQKLQVLQIRTLATFLIVQICLFVKIQVTSIYVRTTLFTELSILSSPIRRAIHS